MVRWAAFVRLNWIFPANHAGRSCLMFCRKSLILGAAMLGLGLGVTSVVVPQQRAIAGDMKMSDQKPHDIIDTATGPGMQKVTTVVAAIKAAGLVDALKAEGPFTVFAPTNEAFEKLPAGTVDNLLKPENKD